jgi:hypothetical protein
MWIKKFKLFDEVPADGGEGSAAPAAVVEVAIPQEPSAPVDDSPSDDGINWDDLSSQIDEAESVEFGETDEHAAEPTAPTAPVEPAVEPAAEIVQPEEVVAPVETPQQQFTPEQIQAAENAYAAQLAGLYQFDEETALRLQTEPEKVLPALAAKLHLDVLKAVMQQMQGVLPRMLETQTQSSARETKAKGDFFKAWPELAKYQTQVLQVGAMFRQLNPTASAEEAIQRIGETAMATLGLKRSAPAGNPPPATPTPSYRPAAPGRTSAPVAPQTVWDELSSEDD